MARKGLPKSIIRKYGVTKKAWSVYRNSKKKRRKSRVTTTRRTRSGSKTRSRTMARRRRTYYKKKRRSASRGEKIDFGAMAGAAVFDAVVTPVLTNFMPINLGVANATEALMGYVMYKWVFKKRGMLRKIVKYYTIANGVTAAGNLLGGSMNGNGILSGILGGR